VTVVGVGVRSVADAVLAAPARLGRTRLVCVDGRAGAGKTTFADALAAQLRGGDLDVAVLRLDALYEGWHGLPAMAGRLRREVVAPLATGRSARVRRWDWDRDRWGESLRITPVDVLILDGVGSYARGIDAYVSYLVWLEADASERRRRALARDGDAFAARWDAWAADEEHVLARERTRERADCVVDTSRCTGDD
jgi:uridine kinase